MTREEAIRRIKAWNLDLDDREVLAVIIPELAESEDERIRRTLVEYFGPKAQLDFVRGIPIQKIRDWLEKQKEHKVDIDKLRKDLYQSGYNDGYQHGKEDAQKEQKPAEWSEEDKRFVRDAIAAVEAFYSEGCGQEELVNWLKSLRPSWKPSEEQMEALKDAVRLFKETHFEKFHYKIESLYEQLKKLM